MPKLQQIKFYLCDHIEYVPIFNLNSLSILTGVHLTLNVKWYRTTVTDNAVIEQDKWKTIIFYRLKLLGFELNWKEKEKIEKYLVKFSEKSK